jgi:hypothetical protein
MRTRMVSPAAAVLAGPRGDRGTPRLVIEF